jgi:hypothetical protein
MGCETRYQVCGRLAIVQTRTRFFPLCVSPPIHVLLVVKLMSRFAVVVVPVFEDLEEQQTSPYRDEDWYEERTSWKWMNTIMRVNSLVQKVSQARLLSGGDS